MIPSWIDRESSLFTSREKLQLSPQKLPVSYIFIRSAAHYSFTYGIVSCCQVYLFLQTSDSANFILEIQATCTSMSITLTFGMCTQILESTDLEPATKFCNWIHRSSWVYMDSRKLKPLVFRGILMFQISFPLPYNHKLFKNIRFNRSYI